MSDTGTSVQGLEALGKISSSVAYDLASGLWERDIVFQKYGITEEAWDIIRVNPRFIGMMREAVAYWNGQEGIDRRIRAKAKIMLEEILPDLFNIAKSDAHGAGTRLAAVERMQKLSGMDKDDAPQGQQGPVFAINIHLGEDREVNISGTSKREKADDSVLIEHEP